jgi:type IV secretion system protein VirB8
VDNAVALSRLPATQSQAVVTAALWEYVRLREGYSYDTAQYGYDAVSGMSADAPRSQYQRWFNYPNAQSPQVMVGKKGTIEIEHIASANISENVQQIRYRRVLTLTGQQPIVTTWTATLQFETVAALPAALRLRNPGGVIVTSYQAAEDSTQ